MKTTTIIFAALLALAGCKQSENVNTTSSSETTSTVAETPTTEAATAPLTDTTASTGAMTETARRTLHRGGRTSTAPIEGSGKRESAKKNSGPTVTETVTSTGAAGLPKNPPPPPKSAPAAIETMGTNPSASNAGTGSSSNATLASTGQGIFKSQCVACHGSDASGNTAIGKKNNIPDFRSSAVQGLSDSDLANVIANGKGPISASAHKSKHLSGGSDQSRDRIHPVARVRRTIVDL